MAYDKKINRGVFAALMAADTTTIGTSGTYVPIEGSFSNTPIDNFELSETPAIKYIGKKTCYFEIDWQTGVSSDSATTVVHCGIKLNGVLVTESVMGTLLKTKDEPQAFSGTVIIELKENDEIQLVTTSDNTGGVLTYHHYTTSIRPFYEHS